MTFNPAIGIGKASTPNTPSAVLEIYDKGYDKDTPARTLQEDAYTLSDTLRQCLPVGTLDRLLVSLLSHQIGAYQDKGDEESMRRAGVLIEAADIVRSQF